MKIQENNSGKIIDRNWLLKRKRKRVSCNSDASTGEKGTPPESSRSPASTKKRRKDEMQFSQAEPKLRGHDGHYFECVACELGGNLLCCDSCPRTYHLACLNPPLKRTPPGKWKCPTCLEQRDSLYPLRHSKIIFKRARTKSASTKARSDLKLQSFGKMLLSDPSTVSEDIGSFKKGKSTATASKKKSGSFQMDNTCSTSSDYSSGNGTPVNTKSMGKHKALHEASSTSGRKIRSSIKVSNSCSSSKTPKVKPNLSDSSQMEPTALVSKPANRSKIKTRKITEEEDDIKLACGITEEARRKKKQRGKSITMLFKTTFKKKTLSPGVTGSHKKHNQSSQQISSLVNHDSSEHKLTEGIEVGDLLKFGNEVLQVDRILGCRVKGNDLRSGCILTKNSSLLIDAGKSSTNIANRLQSAEETILETEEEQLHVSEDDDNLREAKDAITALVEEGNDVNNKSIRETTDTCTTILDENNIYENDQKTSFKEEKHASLDEHQALNSSIPGEQDAPHEYEKGINEKKLSDVNTDPQLDAFYSGDHKVAKPNSAKCGRAKDIIQTASEENLAQKPVELSGSDVTHEFLVKWVGKSVIHTSWLPESQVKLLAKRKLENYKAKYGTTVINICQEQWARPQRVIGLRGMNDSSREALIKWCGLPYDECTWERLDEPIIQKCAHLISQFSEFESKTLIKDTEGNLPKVKGEAPEVVPLLKQPQELKGGSLFPHQLEALNWLRKCWHKSKNVILADEMGLGKTISACAFLSSVYHEFRAKLPSLVLVPLSTMPNWFAEFSLWAPHLNVVEYHGGTKARSVIRQYEWHASDPDRHKLSKSYKFNVLLTTYEMILTDYSHLRGVPWEVLVVDEGHRLKNSGSKLFSMLNTFSFEHRILLTGTPLQNNIGEMYNLLNFLQPVSFSSLSAFEEKFNDLTTAEKVEELKKLVAPHMLRRLKKDAMQNIPPKTERMVPVELTSIQAEYYRAMLTKNYQILRNLGRGGVQSMLNIVMQLRKVCNHPYLIPGTEPESGSVEFLHEMRIKASAKLTLLHSMLKILHREGHRVLIFSQMTKLLDILEDYVTIEFGPKTFERVDGSVSVSDRQAAIARFNQDKSRFIFLLSTRSCGLGINLATADTVVIYDSDFNPHADIQAMNRAHRIGQSNRLLVYRLVVRASVEERILQLARKKLMLDQLFVNKSGSQKEVEDILRWGTEELFSDCDGAVLKDHNETCYNKLEAPADGEQRHRRRVGGLGDVYQDRCTDGSTKVLWDENAILKLLDRSNLQSGSSDGVDADLDNDMLGSLKEWNDEPAEEQVGPELLPDDGVYGEELAAENKEDNVANDIEENEWDRLLRIRWEKYQNEEEASLGRGKRLRKAVSYRETFATLQTETLSESGNDEEEQEPEYSPAGRAFKEKYSRLRARQKDRLLQRQTMGESCLASPLVHEPEGVLQPSRREGLNINDVAGAQKYHITSQDKENINSVQLSHQMGIHTEPSSRAGRFTKHGHKRHQNSPLDFSVKPSGCLPTDIVLPSHQFHGAGSSTSLPVSNHLPVLGLCAPNASQMDAVKRNLNSSVSAALRSSDQNMTSTSIPEFPFPPPCDPGSSADVNVRDREGVGTERLLPEFLSDASNGYLKNNIPNRYFPFNPHLPISSQDINTLIHINNSKSMLHALDEKMGLQDLALDGNKLQRFSIPNMHGPISFSDVFHNLSLDMKAESRRELRQDFLNIPSAPNFRHLNESLKQKEQPKDPPTLLGLGQIEAANLLPDNHKKVLDNIMMRTSAGAHRSMKKKQKIATWSEDELDALWIGVRRHGRGYWDAMLRDSKLKFSRHRTPEDLAARWSQEQQKIMDVPALPVQKPPRSTSFPGVSDGMMARALFGSKFVGSGTHAPKFQSHLTDIKLGCGDLKPGMTSLELKDHLGSMGGKRLLFPPWLPGTVPSNVPGDLGAGPSDIAAKLDLPFDLPFQQNPSFSSIADSLGLNCFNCPSMMQHEGKKSPIKFPNLLDRSPNFLYESQKNVPNTKLDAGCSQNRRLSSCQPFMKDDAVADCSKMKNLPHWLRDAVTVPAASPPAPCLPPIISAIAHSVCLLYGPSTIPTFIMPGPPPLEPVDPRRSLKRMKKLHHFNQQNTVEIGSSKSFKNTAAHDTSMFPLTPTIDPLCSDTNTNLSSLNLNVKCSSPLSLVNHGKKISASPEALDFVASSLASGLVNLPSPVIQGTGNPDLPALEKSEASESFGMRMLHDIKAVRGKRKASNNSLLGDWKKLTVEKTCTRFGSRGSSDTDLYSDSASEVEVVKVSLEETLSDGHQSEEET